MKDGLITKQLARLLIAQAKGVRVANDKGVISPDFSIYSDNFQTYRVNQGVKKNVEIK